MLEQGRELRGEPETSRAIRADQIPDLPVARCDVGEPWTELMGGGWPHESKPRVLIYGGPGTYKTTHAIRIGAILSPCLFISTEADTDRQKQIARRANVDQSKLWFLYEPDRRAILRELRLDARPTTSAPC